MRPVVVESPYSGDVRRNVDYLNAALLDCVQRAETPYASHKILTDSLDDGVAEERGIGIRAGFDMAEALSQIGAVRVFYKDLGLSAGMLAAIEHASEIGMRIEFRTLTNWAKK